MWRGAINVLQAFAPLVVAVKHIASPSRGAGLNCRRLVDHMPRDTKPHAGAMASPTRIAHGELIQRPISLQSPSQDQIKAYWNTVLPALAELELARIAHGVASAAQKTAFGNIRLENFRMTSSAAVRRKMLEDETIAKVAESARLKTIAENRAAAAAVLFRTTSPTHLGLAGLKYPVDCASTKPQRAATGSEEAAVCATQPSTHAVSTPSS
jgi:hypothetical protein